MFRFDELTPEQKQQLAKLSPELTAELDQERREYEEQVAQIMTLEKYQARVAALVQEYKEKFKL